MWGKLTSLASVVTGQDDSEDEEDKNQKPPSPPKDHPQRGADDQEIQLVEQQKLIIQLKEMIRDREKCLLEKEEELKKVSLDHSKFKLQSKSKIAGLSKQVEESQKATSDALEMASVGSDESSSTAAASEYSTSSASNSDKKLKAKLSVLRKQLQSKDGQLRDLNCQLDKKNQEVEAKERVMAEREEELKKVSSQLEDTMSKLKVERSPVEDESAEETKKQLQTRLEEMIAQLAYKDNKILELVNQISEKEGGAMDLRELVAEKDEVIKGRDRAIALLRTGMQDHEKKEVGLNATIDRMKWKHEDLEEEVQRLRAEVEKSLDGSKGQVSMQDTEKELEEVTEMREKFNALLAEEKANSASTIERMKATFELRCRDMEGRLIEYGASRDAFLSRAEELEGLLEGVTQEKDDLKKKLKVTEEAELREESVGNKFSKFKALAGSKIKALEKEVDQLREQCNELTQLRNQVSELEEEKGNLQLQAFDSEEKLSNKDLILSQLDEMRQQCEDFLLEINNLRDKNSALEEVAKQQDQIVDKLKRAEAERESALIRSEEQEATIRCLEARFESLRKQLEERAESNATLENENSSLKVSRDSLSRKVKDFEEEVTKLTEMNDRLKDDDLFVFQKSLDDLHMENKFLKGQIESLQEKMVFFQEMEREFVAVREDLKVKVGQLEDAKETLQAKNNLLEDASIRLLEAIENSSALSQKLEIKDLQIRELQEKVVNLSRENEARIETTKPFVDEELRNKLSSSSTQLIPVEEFKVDLSPSTENVVQDAPSRKVVVLPIEMNEEFFRKELEDTRLEVTRLTIQLKEREDALDSLINKHEESQTLRSQLEKMNFVVEEGDRSIEELQVEIEKLTLKISEVDKLEDVLLEKEEIIRMLNCEKSHLNNQDLEMKMLLHGKDGMIQNLLSQIETQSKNLSETETNLSDLKRNLEEEHEKFLTLEKNLSSSQHELFNAKLEGDDLRRTIENLSKEAEEKDERLKLSSEKQQDFDLLLSEFDATVLKLKESYEEKHSTDLEIKRLETLVHDLTHQCDSLKQQNAALQESSTSDSLKQILTGLRDDLATSSGEIQNLISQNLSLETSRDQSILEISNKNEMLMKMSDDLEKMKQEIDGFKKLIVEKDSELEVLRIISKEAQSNVDKSSTDLQSTREELNDLRKKMTEKEIKEQEMSRISIEGGRSEKMEDEKLQTSSRDLKTSKGTASEDTLLEQLNEELSRSKMEAAELREGLKRLETKLLDKDKKIESLSEILEEEEAQLIGTKEELERLKKSCEGASVDLKVKEEERIKLEETLKEKETVIKKYLAILKKQKESLKQAKDDLNKSLNSDEEALKTLQEKFSNLEKESLVLKSEVVDLEASRSRCKSMESVLVSLSKLLEVQNFEDVENKVRNLLEEKTTQDNETFEKLDAQLNYTKKKLEESFEEYQKVVSQKISVETEMIILQDQIMDLNDHLVALKDKLITNDQLLSGSNAEKEKMKEELKNLKAERDSLAKNFESLKSFHDDEIVGLKKKRDEDEERMLNEHRKQIEELETIRLREVESLNSDLDLSQRSLGNFKKEVEVTTEKINELKKIHEADVEHFIKTKQESQVENLKLSSQISDVTSTNTSLESRVGELTTELSDTSERFASLLRENQILEEKILSLESTVENLGSKDEENRHESQIEILKSELLSSIKENDDLRERHANLSEQLEKLRSENSDVSRRLEEAISHSKIALEERELLETTARDMKVEIEKLKSSTEHDREYAQLQENLQANENSTKSLGYEIESLKKNLFEKHKHNENISKQLHDEMKKLEILETEFEESRLEKQQMTETISDLEKRLRDLKKINKDCVKKRDELTKTVERLSKEVEEKNEKTKSIEESLGKMSTENEAKISELSQKIIALEKDNKSEVLEKSERQRSDESDEVELLKKQIENLEEELKKCKLGSEAELKSVRDQFDLLSNDVSSYQHLISKLENNKRHLESQMNDFKPMMAKLKEEMKRQEADKIRLKQNLSFIQSEKEKLMSEMEGLRQRARIAEDLEDHLEMDYKLEVEIYKEKLKDMQEELERSRSSEEELNQVNDKLLQHNNALIKNTEDLFDQLSQYKSTDTSTIDTTIATLTKERDHLRAEMDTLRIELQTIKMELESSRSTHLPESPPVISKVRVAESVIQERLQGSSPGQDNLDMPRVHSGRSQHLGSPVLGEFADNDVRSQVDMLTNENTSLEERLKGSEEKFFEKERELNEFYQQYQLLYQQYNTLQQHLVALQTEKESTILPTADDNTALVAYEKQLKDEHRHLSRQLQVEQERRLEVEEGLKVIGDQYREQHRMLQDTNATLSASSNDNHSIPLFFNEDDERRVLPQDAPLYVQLRHRCLQFKRILTRMDQNRFSLGTIYRYRTHLWKFLILYFIFIHLLFIFRC